LLLLLLLLLGERLPVWLLLLIWEQLSEARLLMRLLVQLLEWRGQLLTLLQG
jgi:hypothetical protein